MDRGKPKRRLRWPAIYAVSSGALTLVVLAAVGVTTCRPAWYAPPGIDRVLLKSDKADFANLLDRIGTELNAGRAAEFEIGQDQLNRWLAARAEIWPALRFELPGFAGLQISLLDGEAIRLAGTASKGPVSVVLSAIVRSRLEPGEVVLEIESLRAGKMPIPSGQVLAPLRAAIARGDGRIATMIGDAIRLRNHWMWKNGNRPFRLERLQIANGIARVRLAPADDE